MIIKHLFGSPLHQHPDPAQRLLGVSELPPDSNELAGLLAADPAAEVRAAAARRCGNVDTLVAAWKAERDPAVQSALAAALGSVLAETPDIEAVRAFLDADECTDAIRSEVVRRTQDMDRQRLAIAALRGEDSLVDLALVAERSETRMAAAERVRSPDALRRLADAAKSKDRGVARLARQRIDASAAHASQAAEADDVLTRMESLAAAPGAILTASIDLDRRWQKLALAHDADRVARWDAARQVLLARFDREREEQQARARFERRLDELIAMEDAPSTAEALDGLRGELAGLRREAVAWEDPAAGTKLQEAERRLEGWARDLRARGEAEALVAEAERLAEGTSIDDAGLPGRWESLNRSIRTPALTRRFEAALVRIEQHRLAQVQAAEQSANAARHELHRLLHAAEQALTAGQVHAARAAADEIKVRKPHAGSLPKPTIQRLGRLVQQLSDLERWESFGQRDARMRLCERAEALTTTLDAVRLAGEVRKLREEWKALDQQHPGVPKALWERFNHACERAYAPAARHFAEVAAQRKEARRKRDAFVEAAAVHAAQLVQEPRDWRAIEHWLRDTDRAWRGGDLGSVEQKAWDALDGRFKAAVAPLRDALAEARSRAKAGRQVLIDEATALAGKATERDAPARVKELQARWQAQARELALTQRDERALWERFRAACNAVFDARQAKRQEEQAGKHEAHRALDAICLEVERLAAAMDKDESEIRRSLRDLEERWRKQAAGLGPLARGAEARFGSAKAAVEAALSARLRSREAAVWQTLAAKERLCEALDARVRAGADTDDGAVTPDVHERWAALPALPAAWEKRMLARRDAAVRALAESEAAIAYASRIEQGNATRGKTLLELEISLGLESPPDLHAERLALQVAQLRQRFQSAAPAGTSQEKLIAWCAEPGVADARDRQRCEKVFAAIDRARREGTSRR